MIRFASKCIAVSWYYPSIIVFTDIKSKLQYCSNNETKTVLLQYLQD